MIRRLLSRFASDASRAEVKRLDAQLAELRSELDAATRVNDVLQAEVDAQADVIARDRERIRAEGAAYARRVAEAEAGMHLEE